MIRTGADRARVSGIFEAPRRRRLRAPSSTEAGIELDRRRDPHRARNPRQRQVPRLRRPPPRHRRLPQASSPPGSATSTASTTSNASSPTTPSATCSTNSATRAPSIPSPPPYDKWRTHRRRTRRSRPPRAGEPPPRRPLGLPEKEIETVAPHPAEDADLEQQRRLLSNVNRLAESATAAYDALYDSPESCLAGLRAAIKRLDDLLPHRRDDDPAARKPEARGHRDRRRLAGTPRLHALATQISDTFPAACAAVTWTCSGAGGGVCPAAAGAGDLATTADLPAGGSVTFLATCAIDPAATGSLTNTATVAPGPGSTTCRPATTARPTRTRWCRRPTSRS